MVTLKEFTEKIAVFNLRETFPDQFGRFAGLGAMYCLIDSLGWFNSLVLQLQIFCKYRGEQRSGYLECFTMYRGMRRRFRQVLGCEPRVTDAVNE